jgi:hypothetical protein
MTLSYQEIRFILLFFIEVLEIHCLENLKFETRINYLLILLFYYNFLFLQIKNTFLINLYYFGIFKIILIKYKISYFKQKIYLYYNFLFHFHPLNYYYLLNSNSLISHNTIKNLH